MTTENLSLLETKHLVEKSRGKLTMMVLRDDRRFLVNIPEVADSAPNSEEDRRRDSSSELEGEKERGGFVEFRGEMLKDLMKDLFEGCFLSPPEISDIEEDVPPQRTSRQPNREKRTRRYRSHEHTLT